MTLYEKIGERIRELRTTKKLSQDALAKILDVPANTISRWETATYKPTPVDLENLSRYFSVPITIFFENLHSNEDRISALASATGDLSPEDFDELIRYAEFRKVRRAIEGQGPKRVSKRK